MRKSCEAHHRPHGQSFQEDHLWNQSPSDRRGRQKHRGLEVQMYVQWELRFTLSNHTTTSGLTHFSEKGFNADIRHQPMLLRPASRIPGFPDRPALNRVIGDGFLLGILL
jgi:hypothetical protein